MNWGIGFEKVGSIRIIIIIEWYGWRETVYEDELN
jgi:hypothetical protein